MSRRRRLSNPYRKPDHYTKRAKQEGFSARRVFKLEEINRRFPIMPRGKARIVDLGCAPGSWSEWVDRTMAPGSTLVGVDIKEVATYPGTFLLRSITELPPAELAALLGGPADLVLSDMAPYTTGNRLTDHVEQLALARLALEAAATLLRPGGHFVAKVFDGEDAHGFVQDVRRRFSKARRLKPKATRESSVEFFVLGLGFEG